MIKLVAPVSKKQTLTFAEESDSESENVPLTVTSTCEVYDYCDYPENYTGT